MNDKKHFHIDSTTKIKQEILETPDEKKRKFKKEEAIQKETYEVLQAGQADAKKAAPHVAAQAEADIKEQNKMADDIKNRLESKKRFIRSYMGELAQGLSQVLQTLDWVRGWTADVVVTTGAPIMIKGKGFATKEGILLVVTTPDGRVMHQGMRVTGEPALDYAGIYTLALQTENTMDAERGLLLDGKPLTRNDGDAPAILGVNGRPITGSKQPAQTNG